MKSNSLNSFSSVTNTSNTSIELEEQRNEHEKDLLEEQREQELRINNISSTSDAIERINRLDFGGNKPTPEIISNQIEFWITRGSSYLSETFDDIGREEERENTIFLKKS